MRVDEMVKRLADYSAEVNAEFGTLSDGQLNWKQSEEQWGVAQCLDHLVFTGKSYVPIISGALEGQHNKSIWEKLPVLPKMGGNFILRGVNPENTKKFPAPKAFQPSSSSIDRAILSKFEAVNTELAALIGKTDGMETEKMVITSPISKFFTLPLDIAMELIVQHERRHLNQAKRVTESEGFPK